MKKVFGSFVTCFVLAVGAALLWYPVSAAEERIALEDVPAPVRAAIEQQAVGGRIVEVEKETKGGEVVYEAEVKQDGRETDILVSSSGEVLGQEPEEDGDDDRDDDGDDDAGDGEKVPFRDLPDGVQETLNKSYAGVQFYGLSREMENGHEVYEAAYREGEIEHELSLTADGYVLASEEAVVFESLPPAVQLAMDTHFVGAKIAEMERVQVTFYEVELTKADGTEVEVRVLPNGEILEDDSDDDDDDDDEGGEEDEDDQT